MKVRLSLFKDGNRKAQVTLFVIIGVVVVLATAGIFYMNNLAVKQKTGEGVIRQIETPIEVTPIKNFVEDCVEQTALKALDLIESQGGYIDTSHFDYAIPTEGNAVEFSPGFVVPYWYYMKSRNTCTEGCTFASEMPKLCREQTGLVERENCITSGEGSIEEQMDDYMDANLRGCLDKGFEEFDKQGYAIEELEGLEVDTTIRNGDVVLTLHYPLKVIKNGMPIELEYFQRVVYSDLSEMYKIAFELTNYESENCMIEYQVLNYVSYFMGLDEGKLPPISESTIGEYGMHIWLQPSVKEMLKPKFANAMQLIRVYNTSGFSWPETDTPEDDAYYMMDQDILEKNIHYPLSSYHDKTKVYFFYYPWFEPYLEIKPNQGALLLPTNSYDSPSGGEGLLAGIMSLIQGAVGIKEYRFSYQYSFPVIVEVRKTDEIGKEHVFRFAMEPNVRGNTCFGAGSSISYGTSGTSGLGCDEDMLTNDITLIVRNETDGDEVLEGVSVSFYTGDSNCLLGLTDENGRLETGYPSMFGGFFELEKPGYMRRVVYEPDASKPSHTTTLKPLMEKNVKIKLIDEDLREQLKTETDYSIYDDLKESAPEPDDKDIILINLKRIKDNDEDSSHEKMLLFDEGSLMEDTVELLPGSYNVSIQLFRDESITLPEEKNMMCLGGAGDCCYRIPVNSTCSPRGETQEDFEDGDCYIEGYTCGTNGEARDANVPGVPSVNIGCTFGRRCSNEAGDIGNYEGIPLTFDEVEMSMYPNGGAEASFEITDYTYLEGVEDITFYLFKQNAPTRQHHLGDMSRYIDYSNDYPQMVKPLEFS
jgi:hypothetical protein